MLGERKGSEVKSMQNLQFFQIWVLVEGIRNPPGKLVVIQVPESMIHINR